MSGVANDLTFSVDEIFVYMDCPMKHHLQYQAKLKGSNKLVMSSKPEIYNECIQKTIFYFYTLLQKGSTPTLKQLYSKYFSLWNEANGTEEKDIFNRDPKEAAQRAKAEKEQYVHRGYETLQKFYASNAGIEQAILAVNHPYEIIIDGVCIKGTFGLIREVLSPDKERRLVEIVDFNMSKKKPNEFFLNHDLYSTFMHYAFVKTFKEYPDQFTAHYVNQSLQIPLVRTSKEYKRMLRVVESFVKGIQTIKPYPRQSFMCQTCPFLSECDNINFE